MKEKKTRTEKANISIIGGGSWATAIAKILSTNGHNIKWWVRQPETAEYIRTYRHNPKYLSSVTFDLPQENVTSQLPEALDGAAWVILGVPSYYLVDTLSHIKPEALEGKVIVSAIKGIIQDGNLLVSEYMRKKFGVPAERMVNISGPCHAEEVAAEKLSYLTFSSPNAGLAAQTAGLFDNRFMKTRSCTDMIGTEYASVLKNVYAIAAGISVGLGYGDNFRAVLVSRAMEEMSDFLDHIHPVGRNILQAAYLGDTLVTAYSQFSRNRTFGLMIGKGYSVKNAILELNMVAEGYYSTKAIRTIMRENGLDMPIASAVYNILYDKVSPSIEFHVLSDRLS